MHYSLTIGGRDQNIWGMADYGDFKFIKKDCSWWRRMTAEEVRHMLAMVKPPGDPADWIAALERLEKKGKHPKKKAAKK